MQPNSVPSSTPVSLAPPPRRSGKRTRRVRGIIFEGRGRVGLHGVRGPAGPPGHDVSAAGRQATLHQHGRACSSLQALCALLPGPTSTQTITVIGFRLGGPNLAYLTLLVWMTPAVVLMTLAALTLSHLDPVRVAALVQFVQPVAVGFVAFSAYRIAEKVIHTKTAVGLMVASAMMAYFFQLPWMLPLLLLAGGAVTTVRYRKHAIIQEKAPCAWSGPTSCCGWAFWWEQLCWATTPACCRCGCSKTFTATARWCLGVGRCWPPALRRVCGV
ncbi:chromate transporter [Hymenobacter humi]|uniref:Chromate transporter n=1 Tax=Hymenobacter humi TaxID=1411620 RepID=A0ABW2U2B3_9BACT